MHCFRIFRNIFVNLTQGHRQSDPIHISISDKEKVNVKNYNLKKICLCRKGVYTYKGGKEVETEQRNRGKKKKREMAKTSPLLYC